MFVERSGGQQVPALPASSYGAEVTDVPRKEDAQSPPDPVLRYKTIFAKLAESEPLPATVLIQLAEERAVAVVAELTVKGGLAPERLGTQAPEALESGEAVSARLTLEVLSE